MKSADVAKDTTNNLVDDILPEDSASQTHSSKSAGSIKVPVLAAYSDTLEEKQQLDLEEVRIKQKLERLRLRTDLLAARAEANVKSQAGHKDEQKTSVT